MRTIRYSSDYKEKMLLLRNDLDLKYGKTIRQRIFAEIDSHIERLKDFPFLGISLHEMYGIDCPYYYIRSSKNVIFYEPHEKRIDVLNIYSEREEYMIKFLGSRAGLNEPAELSFDNPLK